MNRCPCTAAAALLLATLGSLPAQALTENSVNVSSRASAPTLDGVGMHNEAFRNDSGAAPIALSTGTGPQSGQREPVLAFDGKCVVIATGDPCQGGEAPLTTQTVLDGSKPVVAREGTFGVGNASAYARDGRVGAKASSLVSTGMSHATIDRANPGRSVPGKLYSTGSANASAGASTRHTNTLQGPAGGVATITLSGVASSSLFINSTPGLGNTASVSMVVQGSAAPPGQRCNNLFLGCVASFDHGRSADPGSIGPIVQGNDHRSFALSFQARTGDIVSLLAYVSVSTSNTGTADASHTLTIDELTLSSGFAFADESAFVRNGNRYVFAAAAVPEPASAALLLAGLLAVAGRARFRRSGPRAC
jgi:hypothetical protein